MTVAIFSECLWPVVNGVSISIATLADALHSLGDEVWIFAPAYPGHRETNPRVIRFPSIRVPGQPDYPLALPFSRRAKQVLRETAFDLVHVNSPFTMARLGARTARRKGIPWVVTYHTLLREYAHYVPLLHERAAPWLIRVSRDFCNAADAVIAPSASIEAELRQYGVRSRIEVIPTGIPPGKKPSADPSWVRQRWQIEAGAPVLVFAGRLAKEKRLGLLLEAFARVVREAPEAVLLLVGGGPEEEAIRSQAEALGLASRIRLTGFLSPEQVMDCYAASDLFVTTSDTETQGVSLLEAMSTGLPAVVVDAYGTGETVRQTGAGLLSPLDAEAFARQVLALLSDSERRRQLGELARRASAEYSADRCAQKVRALYASL